MSVALLGRSLPRLRPDPPGLLGRSGLFFRTWRPLRRRCPNCSRLRICIGPHLRPLLSCRVRKSIPPCFLRPRSVRSARTNPSSFFGHCHSRAHLASLRVDQPGQQLVIIFDSLANTAHHAPHRRPAHVEIARRLHRAQSFFGIEHQGDEQKPALQIDVRVVEYRSDRCRKAAVTGPALPAVGAALFGVTRRARCAAERAFRAMRPADALQMGNRRLACREAAVDLNEAGHSFA